MCQPWLTTTDWPVRALEPNEAGNRVVSATSSRVVNSLRSERQAHHGRCGIPEVNPVRRCRHDVAARALEHARASRLRWVFHPNAEGHIAAARSAF
jgi:hypothetical protein